MNTPVETRPKSQYAMPLLFVVIFFFFLGENIQQAPRTQIYESILCRQQGILPPNTTNQGNSQCKSPKVQSELAALKGLERLFGIIPTILAVPYGILADHYGHCFTMSLALLGVLLEESWPFLVCWLADRIPIRFILLGPLFEIVGGGTAVTSTMMHVVATRISSEDNRTFVFWFIRAISIASAVIAQVLGGMLMVSSAGLTWFLGLISLGISITASLFISINNFPSTSLNNNQDQSLLTPSIETYGTIPVQSSETDAVLVPKDRKTSVLAHTLHMLKETKQGFQVVFANVPLLVLLGTGFSAQLSDDASPMILLLYITGRYHWDFSNATLLSALGDGIQFVVLIIVLPYIRYYLSTNRKWVGYQCDWTIALVGVSILALGALILGLASSIQVAVIGIILISSAGGIQAATRSLITEEIREEEINLVYSVFTILQRISSAIAGPIYTSAYTMGLRLDGGWFGLPFFVASIAAAVSTMMLFWVRSPPQYQPLSSDDRYRR